MWTSNTGKILLGDPVHGLTLKPIPVPDLEFDEEMHRTVQVSNL